MALLDGRPREVTSVSGKGDLFVVKTLIDGKQKSFKLTKDQASEALIARDEDMYSSTILDLRYKESMLMGQIAILRRSEYSYDCNKAMIELERTLYTVRFALESKGARRVSDE